MTDRVSLPIHVFAQMSQAAQETGYKYPTDQVKVVHETSAINVVSSAIQYALVFGIAYLAISKFFPATTFELPQDLLENSGKLAGKVVPYVAPSAANAFFSLGFVQERLKETKETLSNAYETTTSFFSSVKTIAFVGVFSYFMNSGARLMGR